MQLARRIWEGVGFTWEVVEDMEGGMWEGGFSKKVVEVRFHGYGPSGTHQACQGPICILKAQLFQNANADAGDKRY